MFALEKRGYVKAGPWTPEATVEHPEAGLVMHVIILLTVSLLCYFVNHYGPSFSEIF